jgi:hypothetical protein
MALMHKKLIKHIEHRFYDFEKENKKETSFSNIGLLMQVKRLF